MAADTFSGKTARDVITNLSRIATALESISDTLAKMHDADPVAAINAALAAEAGKEPAADPLAHIPESERYRFR